jgi:hypothetical protein
MLCPDANPGRSGGKPATNRFSYGTAYLRIGVIGAKPLETPRSISFLLMNASGYIVLI